MELKGLEYCQKCIMPNTQETGFEKGICPTCKAQETKTKINWADRKKELEKILMEYKGKSGSNYDCIVPISGGKDSVYQLHVICKEFGLKPLAVTFDHNWFSTTGKYNLWNALEKFDIDHVQFTPSRSLVNKLAKKSIEKMGDFCYHCHAGVAAFTLKIAVSYNIPLIIWGESGSEYGHQGANYDNMVKFDRDYFQKLSTKIPLDDMIDNGIGITKKDLFPFELPTVEECKNINGIHLGDYIPWNTEEQVKLIKEKYDWKEREVGGSYKNYKSIECAFAPLHDFLCLLKRGFGRSSIFASQEIRDGKLIKEQSWELIEKYERIEPKYLHWALTEIGLSPEQFRKWIEKLKVGDFSLDLGIEWRDLKEDGMPFVQRFIHDFGKI